VILAADEASLYLPATTMRVWAPRGQTPVVRAAAGREKTSFYGTLNLCTGAEIVMPSARLNAEATAAHLEQILAAHPNVPLLLLWDRAPWHRGAAIQAVLEANPRLDLVRLPVAAPELNPQEHVWKATRQAGSRNQTAADLATLADRFKAHLTTTMFPTSFLEHRGFYSVHPMSNW
jgi:transposase